MHRFFQEDKNLLCHKAKLTRFCICRDNCLTKNPDHFYGNGNYDSFVFLSLLNYDIFMKMRGLFRKEPVNFDTITTDIVFPEEKNNPLILLTWDDFSETY